MQRRSFLHFGAVAAAGISLGATKAASARPALRSPHPLIKPPALRPGDRVALINPSTAIHDPAAVQRARDVITALGLVPAIPEGLINRPRDLEGSVTQRLREIHEAFKDPSIRAVFCARGGYGVSEIMHGIDYGVIRENPKVFLGFSDITLLHLAIRRQTGLVTFHGRMPGMREFPAFSLEALRRAVFGPGPLGQLSNPSETDPSRPAYPLRTIAGGTACGPLVGGNLSMIIAAMGTPWEIDTRGAILFFEDVDESPYRVARMLLTLEHAGKLRDAAGIVVGHCTRCDGSSDVTPYSLQEVFDQVLGRVGVPVFGGLVLGHTSEQLTVPIGVKARIDADACILSLPEAGVDQEIAPAFRSQSRELRLSGECFSDALLGTC